MPSRVAASERAAPRFAGLLLLGLFKPRRLAVAWLAGVFAPAVPGPSQLQQMLSLGTAPLAPSAWRALPRQLYARWRSRLTSLRSDLAERFAEVLRRRQLGRHEHGPLRLRRLP